ncbi:hypothetical protein [Pseudanabaena sp. FACHB-2040]|uniref:hypothetical protein n=1 Tax=Pseudanabaena sp. FACHB-2040 TaxID=2692859 RepID=UPI00168800D6|nr:hypothetical protein [Pseudanabaena sp. FACHB-2040]MBD2257860.1 hypothetical protein [Pseudanabaena sp. FACHB-2040]
MSQSSEVDTLTLSANETSELDAATLVDSYAEHLMDNLFEDVDRLLDGSEEVAPVGSGQLVTVMTDSTDNVLSVQDSPEVALQTLEGSTAVVTTPPPPHPVKRRWLKPSLEYVLLLGALCSAVGLGVLWAINQQRLSQATPVAAGASSAVAQPVQSNPEFLNYLQRSLEVIANRSGSSGSSASVDMPTVAVLPGSSMVVPPAPVGAPAISGAQGPVNVIERVYIPYQSATAPATVPPTAAAPTAPTAPAAGQPANVAAGVAAVHTLVGVLELGSRSAALFEVSGVPQRIYIGERVGSSGWSLVSVSNEEAVIRRNGEVRSVFIGQKF